MTRRGRRCLTKFQIIKHFARLRTICVACGLPTREQYCTVCITDGPDKADAVCDRCLREVSELTPHGGELMNRLRAYYGSDVELPDYLNWQSAEAEQAEVIEYEKQHGRTEN